MQLFEFEQTDSKTTYRRRALMEHGAFCNLCEYGLDTRMLDVDHIDGNRKNGKLDNLQVLCVWCHALKTRGVNWHSWKGTDIAEIARDIRIERTLNKFK